MEVLQPRIVIIYVAKGSRKKILKDLSPILSRVRIDKKNIVFLRRPSRAPTEEEKKKRKEAMDNARQQYEDVSKRLGL